MSLDVVPKFNIGEVVSARDRLWRIYQIHIDEVKKVLYYSVSNITGIPSSQVLFPNIEEIKKSSISKPSAEIAGMVFTSLN